MDDTFYMQQALNEARKSAVKGEVPVGAVIVASNRIIARTHNLTETLNDVTAHAEIQAITAAAEYLGGKYLTDCTMYVTLEPCAMCAGALYWSKISRVVWGASDEKRGFSNHSSSLLHPQTETTWGILAHDCATLLTAFFQSKRK